MFTMLENNCVFILEIMIYRSREILLACILLFRKRGDVQTTVYIDVCMYFVQMINNTCNCVIYLSIKACLKPLKIPNIHPSGNPVRTQLNAVRIGC